MINFKHFLDKKATKLQKKFNKNVNSKDFQLKKIKLAHKTKILDLKKSKLNQYPVESLAVIDLKKLILDNNQLNELPDLSTFSVLNTFSCKRNELSSSSVFLLPNALVKCDLSFNQFSEVPKTLENCVKLNTLKMSNNKLKGNLPLFLSKMSSLTEMDFSSNSLTGFDEEFIFVKGLIKLDLSDNEIEIKGIHNIFKNSVVEYLLLNGNKVTKKEIMDLTNFESFEKRRQERINKKIAAGIEVDTRLCGLE